MHEHGFERRGRRGRVFDSSELQIVVLELIGERSRHGYELIREIESRSGGRYAPSPGMIYPTLSLLLELGSIEEVGADGARKSFAITQAGRVHLAENETQLIAAQARLVALAESADWHDPAPLRRAMGNLRQVLIAASAKPGFDEKKVLEAARLIDEVSGTIERM